MIVEPFLYAKRGVQQSVFTDFLDSPQPPGWPVVAPIYCIYAVDFTRLAGGGADLLHLCSRFHLTYWTAPFLFKKVV